MIREERDEKEFEEWWKGWSWGKGLSSTVKLIAQSGWLASRREMREEK